MPNHLTEEELEMIRNGMQPQQDEPKKGVVWKNMLLFVVCFMIFVLFGYLMIYFGTKA